MKFKLLALMLGTAVSASALASPIPLVPGGIYFQFTNLEQTATGLDAEGNPLNNTATCTGCTGSEGNWGIAQVSVIRAGSPDAAAGVIGNDVNNTGTPPYFSDQILPPGAQVTAMFHGATQTSVTPFINPITGSTILSLKSTGGYIDFYWDDASSSNTIVNINSLTPAGRTGNSSFTGITDGIFLGRLAFASGINAADGTTFIQGTIDLGLANNSGSADSYANVVDFNNDGEIDGLDGLWAGQLNTDYFGTVFGTRDVRFSNKIDNNATWNGVNGVLGQTSNDPGRGFVVPEPASLALVGLGLLGVAAIRRRRNT